MIAFVLLPCWLLDWHVTCPLVCVHALSYIFLSECVARQGKNCMYKFIGIKLLSVGLEEVLRPVNIDQHWVCESCLLLSALMTSGLLPAQGAQPSGPPTAPSLLDSSCGTFMIAV